jgi:hypothetical protein
MALRALNQARRLGLVDWTERRVRARRGWLRTSNSYALAVPVSPVDPRLKPVWWRKSAFGQNEVGGESVSKQESQKEADKGHKAALAALMREAEGLPDLLAMRRQVMEARMLTR